MVHHLQRKGHQVVSALDGKQGLHALQSSGPFNVLVTDLMMPGMSGLELLRYAKKLDPLLEVIVITAAPSLEMAISALREDGAFDYLTKPLEIMGELSIAVERAGEQRRLKIEKDALRGRLIHGADKLRVVLANTSDAILAIDNDGSVIVASADIARHLAIHDLAESDKELRLPERLAGLISQWRALGCPKSANVEVDWPEDKTQFMSISPMQSDDGNSGGWVLALHDASTQKRIESFIIRNLISLGEKVKHPVFMAESILDDLENLISSNGAQVAEKVAAIKDYIEREVAYTFDLSAFEYNLDPDNSTKVPLPIFMSKENERLIRDFQEGYQQEICWNTDEELPFVEVNTQQLHYALKHLLHWALIMGKGSSKVTINCRGDQSNRVWFHISNSDSTYYEPIEKTNDHFYREEAGKFERSEIHLAFAKYLLLRLESRLWSWKSDNQEAFVAFCLPAN
jgi:CheY-like chemotaxis protein